MQIIGLHPDWLNQNLQGGAQPPLLLRPPGDSDVHSHVRNICFAATSVSSLTGTKLPRSVRQGSELRPGALSSMESESESHSVLSDSLRPRGLYSPWNSPGQNTGVGSLSLLQGIFPTQGSNPVSCIAGRFFTCRATRENWWLNSKRNLDPEPEDKSQVRSY